MPSQDDTRAVIGTQVYARKITVWCESDLPDDADIAAALEEGRLWEVCSNVQYMIEAASA